MNACVAHPIRLELARWKAAPLLGLAAAALIFFSGAAHAQKMLIPESNGSEVAANTELNNDQLAARFLDQATAGATPQGVASLSAALAAHPATAFSDWLNAQFSKPVQDSDLSLPFFVRCTTT